MGRSSGHSAPNAPSVRRLLRLFVENGLIDHSGGNLTTGDS